MFTVARNLPGWLLAVLAVCVAGGLFQSVLCRLDGCKAEERVHASSSVGHAENSGPVPADDHHCACQCHFLVAAPGQFQANFVVCRVPWGTYLVPSSGLIPQAEIGEIEYPPRAVRA